MNSWIDSAKIAMLDTLCLISYLDLLIFLACFLIFVLFYFLGCMSARIKILAIFLKTLAWLGFLATPCFVLWLNQNVLFESKVEYKMAKTLEYSPTFFVDATLSNIGKSDIKRCYFVLKILREPKGYKNQILNTLIPLKTYKYTIKHSIKQGKSLNYTQTINNFDYAFYQSQFFCYGG